MVRLTRYSLLATRDSLTRNDETMKRIFDFLSSVRVELEKVTWPTPELTIRLTVVVILVTIIVAFFLGGIDFLLTKMLELILQK